MKQVASQFSVNLSFEQILGVIILHCEPCHFIRNGELDKSSAVHLVF